MVITLEDFLLDLTFVEWVKSEGHKDISHPWTQWYQTHQSQQYSSSKHESLFWLLISMKNPLLTNK
jgi:hypothetical protein